MKKFIILQLLLTFSISTHAMEKLSWKQETEAMLKEMLALCTPIPIDAALWLRKTIHRPIMAHNPDKFIKINQAKLKKIEQDLRKQEENQIHTIFKENGLNNKQIKKAKNILKGYHGIYKQLLHEPNPNTIHDPQLKDSINVIQTQLAEQNMNINSTNIIQSDIPADFGGSTTATAATHPLRFRTKIIKKKTFLMEVVEPAKIVFRINHPYRNDISLHEAEHLIEGHGTTRGAIKSLVHHFTGNEIKETEALYTLCQIHEKQAEILPSLRKAKSASIMRHARFLNPYPYMLYTEHYLNLSDIDETHKMIAYLEHIKKHPRKPMPQVKRSKFF